MASDQTGFDEVKEERIRSGRRWFTSGRSGRRWFTFDQVVVGLR